MIENQTMCAHLKVGYRPKEHANGTKSDRWICLSCGGDFWPQYWLFPAPWTRKPTPEEEAYGLTLEPLAQEALARTALHKEGLPAIPDFVDEDDTEG